MADFVTVYPRPGVTVYLPGGVHGFRAGRGVPMRPDHAAQLAAHVMTEDEKKADDAAAKAKAASDVAAARVEAKAADAVASLS